MKGLIMSMMPILLLLFAALWHSYGFLPALFLISSTLGITWAVIAWIKFCVDRFD